jgi:hypothetical protein
VEDAFHTPCVPPPPAPASRTPTATAAGPRPFGEPRDAFVCALAAVRGWLGARVANNVHRFTSAEAAGQLRTLRTELAALEAELHTEGLDLLQCAAAPMASAVAVSCGVERVACARGLRACVRISH